MVRFLRDVLPPLAALTLAIAAWYFAVRLFDPPRYLFPSPGAVLESVASDPSKLVAATGRTAVAATAALGVSFVAGTLIGFLFSQSATIRRSLYPYAIFLQTVPIVAIAPLVVLWFGYGIAGVIAVAVIISLFPVVTGATTGLTSVSPALVDLFALHRASRWQMLWKLRLPSAVPHLVTAAKTSSGLAVIGAIVGEFFTGYGGNAYGLGRIIRVAADLSRTADLFAAVLASAALGVFIFATVGGIGALLLRRGYDPST